MILQRLILLCFLLGFFSAHAQENQKDTCIQRIEKISSPKKKAKAYNEASERAWENGSYKKSVNYATRGIEICKTHNLQSYQSYLLNNRGIAYEFQNQYPNALKNYFAALDIQKKLDDPELEANILNNIGLVYLYQKRIKESMGYFKQSLAIRKKMNDLAGISACLNNMAILYAEMQEFEKAIQMYKECIRIDFELEDEMGLGDDYNNISLSYMELKIYDSAKLYMDKALEIRQKIGDSRSVAETLGNIGSLYYNQGFYEEAHAYLLQSVPLSAESQDRESLRYFYDMLWKTAVRMKDTTRAFSYYKNYVAYRDSIDNSKIARQQTELELNYAFKQEREMDRLKQQEKDRQQMIILYSVITGLVLILAFSVLLFRKWKETQRQQQIIEEKNKLVQQKNDEILDSINYAKRIQRAILPADSELRHNFPGHFVCYLPKDIVSGDFYWHDKKDELFFLAVADCTGHGVPGALMSVVCHNALNRSLHEYSHTRPANILNTCNELVVKELSKSWDNVRDGMDISLLNYSAKTGCLEWAGANNPLWILRANSQEIEEIKPDKKAIGHGADGSTFTSHVLEVSKGDRCYLFSDGFADQFGGPKGKKFLRKSLQNLLLECQSMPIQGQGPFLMEAFQKWKGELEQVDDVCVVGIEFA